MGKASLPFMAYFGHCGCEAERRMEDEGAREGVALGAAGGVERVEESGRLGQLVGELLTEARRVTSGRGRARNILLRTGVQGGPTEAVSPLGPGQVTDAPAPSGVLRVHRPSSPGRGVRGSGAVAQRARLHQRFRQNSLGWRTEEEWSQLCLEEGQPEVWLRARRTLTLGRDVGALVQERLSLHSHPPPLSSASIASLTSTSPTASGTSPASRSSPASRLGLGTGGPGEAGSAVGRGTEPALDLLISEGGQRGDISLRPVPPLLFLNGVPVSLPPTSAVPKQATSAGL